MTKLKDFMMSIDKNTPKNIISQLSLQDIEKYPAKSFSFNALAWHFWKGATVEHVGVYEGNLMLLLSKGGCVFGLNWRDGFGATLCEYLPPEPLADNKN